jgi:hypothetical protein
MIKPPILDVIAARLQLRRRGRRWWGLCPFHSEKTPSFIVSEEGGRFYCFGCHEKGDVITFLMKLDGLNYPEAITQLGIQGHYRPKSKNTPRYRTATMLACWLNQQHLNAGATLRDISRQIAIAEQIPDVELAVSLHNEWKILSDLHDDLANPNLAADLWAVRDTIEAITGDVNLEAAPEFPPITESYREHLRSVVEC